jgi:hypothetical protein
MRHGRGLSAKFSLLLMMAGAAPLPGAAAVTHCKANETIVFSCSTGSRILSICASRDLSKNAGYMQYRYGQAGKPELVFPEMPRHPAGLFTPGTLSFSGGGGAYLKFSKPPYAYTIFSAIGNWGRSGKATAQGSPSRRTGRNSPTSPAAWTRMTWRASSARISSSGRG